MKVRHFWIPICKKVVMLLRFLFCLGDRVEGVYAMITFAFFKYKKSKIEEIS